MQVTTIKALDKTLNKLRKEQQIIGLVPTMGALHEGHLALVDHAYKDCNIVVVSIFVNPTQFNNASDLEKYPRNLADDIDLLYKNNSKTIVFTPSIREIYKKDIKAEDFDFGSITQYMEGEYRQGHFNGVGTIIKHLFEIVKPHKAYFGEKDYQQLQLIKKLVKITQQPVIIVGSPTYREPSGLAKSSRNKRLSNSELEKAAILFKALSIAKNNFNQLSFSEIKEEIKTLFEKEECVKLEYFEIAEEENLIPTGTKKEQKKYRAFIAAVINEVRLIDNMAIN